MADEKKQGKQGSSQTSQNEREQKHHIMMMERALDETLAESFPASDPLSSIPDPAEEEPNAA